MLGGLRNSVAPNLPRFFSEPGHAIPADNRWRGLPVSLSLIGLVSLLGLSTHLAIGVLNLGILYMIVVIRSALWWGRRVVIVSAISSALLLDFFFAPSYRIQDDLSYALPLFGLLAVGLLVSMLTIAARQETHAAQRRETQTEALFSFTKALAETSKLDQTLDVMARHIPETFHRSIVILLPAPQGLTILFRSPELGLDEEQHKAARDAFESGQEVGSGAVRFFPLRNYEGVVGVLGIHSNDQLPRDQQQLLENFMKQAALAITRANLAERACRSEILQETDKFQKALLNSISHNLRTPITSVIGVLHSLLEDEALFDAPTRKQLLETARSEAVKLNRLVQNLLDMSRLEGGAIHVKTEPCDVHDVIGAALEQIGEPARQHPVSVIVAPGLPLVPMDHVLIVQVLVNLIDNALKYSPADAPIEIDARLANGLLSIRVTDRGKGIAEQDIDRVFDKFFRGSTIGAPRGAGLGLSICKGFINAHGGRIWAQARSQAGTEVIFILPMEVPVNHE